MSKEILEVEIKGDSSGLNNEVDKSKKKLNEFENECSSIGDSIKKVFAAVSFAKITEGVGSLISQGIEISSSLTEVENVVTQSFDNMSYKVESFASTAISQFGMSELSAKQTASTYMAMANGLGMAQDAASDMSIELAKLSGDMASFYNVEQQIASSALRSIYTGETEALKQYGVVMTQTNLQQFAMSQGIKTNISDMSQAELVGLRYNFVLNSMKDVQGDFARTSDSFSNQTRILKENWNSLLSILGEKAISQITPFLTKLNELATWGTQNSNVVSTGIDAIKNSVISMGIAFAGVKIAPVLTSIGAAAVQTGIDFVTLRGLGFSTAEILSSSFRSAGNTLNTMLSTTTAKAISLGAAIGGITYYITTFKSTCDDTTAYDKVNSALIAIGTAATTATVAVVALNVSLGNVAMAAVGIGALAGGAYLSYSAGANQEAQNNFVTNWEDDREMIYFRGAMRSKSELESLGVDYSSGSVYGSMGNEAGRSNMNDFLDIQLQQNNYIPTYATGSVITKPTVGLIGEYTEAYSNPEIVSPKSTIYDTVKEALTDMGLSSSGNSSKSEEFIINSVTQLDGKTIYKNQNRVKREQGYQFSGMGAFAR